MTTNPILHIPHSYRFIPAEERAQLAPDDPTLALELLRMTDAFTNDLFASTPFEVARMVFPVSRLVCDVERFANDADEPMTLRGMGAVYVKTSDEGPLREHLTPAEQARLIELWYRPHHQRLTQTVDDVISDGIIVGPGPGPAGHRIGTDGWNTPKRLRAEQVAARQRLAILVDRPFADALVPASIIGGRQRSRRSRSRSIDGSAWMKQLASDCRASRTVVTTLRVGEKLEKRRASRWENDLSR